jgi:hypothetical protein
MFPSRRSAAIEHFWYIANGVPYCVYEDTSGNALEQIPPPEGFTCRPWGQIMQRLPSVTHTRLVPSAVITMSLALDVQVGREPGPPGAIVVPIALPHLVGTTLPKDFPELPVRSWFG